MKIELPDAVEDQQPNYCRECGRGLSGIEGSVEFEEERVGFHVIPLTTRHRFLSKACTCGCRNRLDVPKKEKSGLSVGRSQGLGCLSQRSDVHALQPHQEFSARCDAHGHLRGQHTNFH